MELKKILSSGSRQGGQHAYLERAIQILLVASLIILPFHKVWILPVVGKKFQPPEIIFIPLFLATVLYILRNRQKLWFSPIDVGVLGWLGVNVFSGLHVGLSIPISIELLGTLYLTLLYFTIRLTIGELLLKNFPDYLALSATIAALLGIIGWCLLTVGIKTSLVDEIFVLPLLGNVGGRAHAFTAGNNMLAHILMVGILVKVADCWHRNELFSRRNLATLGIMLSGFMFTFSKTGIILLIGLVLVWYFSIKQGKKLYMRALTWMVVLALFLSYNLIALLHPVWKDDPNIKTLVRFLYARNHPVATVGPFDIMLTSYGIQVDACLIAFKESFPWGIGPGEFRYFSERIAKEGLVVFRPGRISQVMPHSTYFGALAQLGVLGILSILILWGLIGHGCYQVFQIGEYRGLAIGLSVSFVATATNATFIDIMNFRQLWWLIAITAVLWHHAHLQKAKDPLGIDRE